MKKASGRPDSRASGGLGARLSPKSPLLPRRAGLVGMLGAAAFVLLAMSLAVRPLLGDPWTSRAADVVSSSPLWWNTSPGPMYLVHIIASLGLLLGVAWVVIRRKSWQFTGLEAAAGILVLAGLVSIPGASDKRLAINVAVGTILPLIVTAVLYQLLVSRGTWRRALLSVLVAAAVANCYTSWRQLTAEFEDTIKHYTQTKEQFWAEQGKSVNDPEVAIYEARLRARQPLGYFYHPNVMASFLLLGVAGALAAAAGFRRTSRQDPGVSLDDRWGDETTAVLVARAILVGVAICQLVVIASVGSAGAKVGLLFAVVLGVIVWLVRRRPIVSGGVCLAVLACLQVTLVVLGLNAGQLYLRWAQAGGKHKSLAVRLNYWQGATTLFAGHPLTGVGPGQFGKRYVAIKPPYASEEVSHPHNWLLNVAAEWGILGLLGTIVALVGPGWKILKRLATAPGASAGNKLADHIAKRDTGSAFADAFLPAVIVAFCCCVLVLLGVVPAGPWVFIYMAVPLFWMLVATGVTSLSALAGRAGIAILFAGLIAFFVHSAVEMAAGVAAAAWPFWGLLGLTLAWAESAANGGSAEPDRDGPGTWSKTAMAGTFAVAALLVPVLSYGPLRSVLAVYRARGDVVDDQPARAIAELQTAASVDSIDPIPYAAMGMVYQRINASDRDSAVAQLQQAVAAAKAAVGRDSQDNVLYNDLAITCARLASLTHEPQDVAAAIIAMQRAVELYPNWPRGRLRLAGMLAAAAEPPNNRPDLARAAIEQMDKALELDAGWPAEDFRRFPPEEIAQVKSRRAEVLGWLEH